MKLHIPYGKSGEIFDVSMLSFVLNAVLSAAGYVFIRDHTWTGILPESEPYCHHVWFTDTLDQDAQVVQEFVVAVLNFFLPQILPQVW